MPERAVLISATQQSESWGILPRIRWVAPWILLHGTVMPSRALDRQSGMVKLAAMLPAEGRDRTAILVV